ncbi:WhiB family transcriptional regulator [Embleya hyalina]|uniref:Transcriptional regulator WhiB2 n=1 Tax=Embleya hyalina TaxID=516124 RepID=A0A401Z3Z7_9ACTN|nr:WhiB family transcriptional regulator [Embleya hyalina]GCE01570.1 transcriptional regulator WhiB2 [Embleya hyalina]
MIVTAPAPTTRPVLVVPYPPTTGTEPCRTDPEDWFPEKNPAALARAQLGCAECPIRIACLAWALAHPRDAAHGVWGGLTPEDRTSLIATLAAPAA